MKTRTKKLHTPSHRTLSRQNALLSKRVQELEKEIEQWDRLRQEANAAVDWYRRLVVGMTVARTGSPSVVARAMGFPERG